MIDDAGETLPTCASLNMARVPSTDDGSLSTSQILSHHDDLCKEFVTIDSLKLCIENMKMYIISSIGVNATASANLLSASFPCITLENLDNSS